MITLIKSLTQFLSPIEIHFIFTQTLVFGFNFPGFHYNGLIKLNKQKHV